MGATSFWKSLLMTTLPKEHTGPGLVDLQVNGYAGLNFNGDPSGWTADEWHRIREMLRRRGVCAVLPTLTTADSQSMLARAGQYAALTESDEQLAAMFPKLHIEGPFVSPVDGPRGVHPREHCQAPADAPDLIDRLRDASADRIGIFTVAPELPGAIELIARLAEAGICPAIGHTEAPAECIASAVAAGAKLSTHLGNGSHQMLPRLDNYVQTQLAEDALAASFIADGHHMPLTTLKNFIRAKTPARSVLVTDANLAVELPPGEYDTGFQTIEVRPDGRCCVPGEPHLAGSVLTLDRAVINVTENCGVDFEQAWAMASVQAAELVGIEPPGQITVEITDAGFALV